MNVVYFFQRAIEKFALFPAFSIVGKLNCRLRGCRLQKGIRIYGLLNLRIAGRCEFGHNVSIYSGVFNYVGMEQLVSIHVGPRGILRIGDNCGISNCTIVVMDEIELLDGTFIGGGTRIYDTDFHALSPDERLNGGEARTGKIRIGPRAFVGGHCIILKGVTIGEASVIGAGAVVTKSVPAWEIWGGNPARFIRKIEH